MKSEWKTMKTEREGIGEEDEIKKKRRVGK